MTDWSVRIKVMPRSSTKPGNGPPGSAIRQDEEGLRAPAKAPDPARAGRPPRTQAAEERRAAILAAALEEFTARGFEGARLDDVAKRAGIAKGTIYLYFADK